MPVMISNRSFFNTYYHIDGCEPGEYQFIVSGIGNEEFVKKHTKIIGRDVVGIVNLNFIGVRPIRNKDFDVVGTFVQQVQRVDLGGSIPDWYRKKKSARHAKDGILKLINYLQEKVTTESEPESASASSEMNFYRMMDQRLQYEIPVAEEQVLKIRLQSRRKQQQSSPMNREDTRFQNRSCQRERTASGIEAIEI